MSGLISRDDAIEAIESRQTEQWIESDVDYNSGLESALCEIKALPSAEPPYQYSEAYVNQLRGERDILQDMVNNMAEPKTGEWIDIDNYYRMATCSHCYKVTMFEKWGEYTRPYNFCPNCGARMEGGESE